MTRILIVDDDAFTRRGLVQTLSSEPEFVVGGLAADAQRALELVRGCRPDLILTELLPGGGLELIRDLSRSRPVVVVTRRHDVRCAEGALRAGARGYLLKAEAGAALLPALRRVLAGRLCVSDEIGDRLLAALAGRPGGPPPSPLTALSNRELEVFELTGRGLSPRQIADRLALSVKTVETYRTRTRRKLHLSGTATLVRHAIRWVEGAC